MKSDFQFTTACWLLLFSVVSLAADDEPEFKSEAEIRAMEDAMVPVGLPPGGVYRYHNKSGDMVFTHTLPEEAIFAGYQVVDRNGRILETVEAAPSPEELEIMRAYRQAHREAEKQKVKDQELMRLYADPEDAKRARDRQISSLNLNIDYARNTMNQVQGQLDRQISMAAEHERAGREVPETIEDNISRLTQRISTIEEEIEGYQKDVEEVLQEFSPIISRLQVIVAEQKKNEPEPESETEGSENQEQE